MYNCQGRTALKQKRTYLSANLEGYVRIIRLICNQRTDEIMQQQDYTLLFHKKQTKKKKQLFWNQRGDSRENGGGRGRTIFTKVERQVPHLQQTHTSLSADKGVKKRKRREVMLHSKEIPNVGSHRVCFCPNFGNPLELVRPSLCPSSRLLSLWDFF